MEQKPDKAEQVSQLIDLSSRNLEETNDAIYSEPLGLNREAEEVRETSSRIESAIMSVLTRLGDANKDATEYGKKLTEFSGNIAEQSDHREVRGLVLGILDETRKISEKNRTLVHSLEASTKEITLLRQNLDKAREEALTDALTGIANRKAFDKRLCDEVAAHQDKSSALSLLMIDIDHFKTFNDTYGHQVGDEALKVVAQIIKDGVKGRDAPARYGGEEFAVILPQTRLQDAITVADHLCNTLASCELINKKSRKSYGTITFSIGAAQYRSGESIDQFVQRADKALYQAKSDGRNRVVAETEIAPCLD